MKRSRSQTFDAANETMPPAVAANSRQRQHAIPRPNYAGTFSKLRELPCTEKPPEIPRVVDGEPTRCYLIFDHDCLRDTFIATLQRLSRRFNDDANVIVVPEVTLDVLDFGDKSSRRADRTDSSNGTRVLLEKDLKNFLLEEDELYLKRFQQAFEYDDTLMRKALLNPPPSKAVLLVACAAFFRTLGKTTGRGVMIISKDKDVLRLAKGEGIECKTFDTS